MRLVFQEGKQKELLKKEAEKRGVLFVKLANIFGVKIGKLNAYYYDSVLMSEELFNKFLIKKDFEKFIIDRKNEEWGKIKGGFVSHGKTKEIKLPEESKELAEFYGIMLGDGNSHRTKSYKKGTYMIRIVGDSRSDKDYLINYVKPLIEELFNIKVSVRFFKNQNAVYIESHSRELINFLAKKEFPPGNKIKNRLRIPNWIKNSKTYLKLCLRGLYDTDGSAYKLTGQNSYQICFTNYNFDLLRDVHDSILSLGINCSKVSNHDVYITKKSEIRKFLKLIGFSNDKHLKKVKMWDLQSPVV